MFSFNLQSAVERRVVGQKRAVHTVVRAVTVALSGLGKTDRPVGIYLLVGPSGTGKTELARALVHEVNGETDRLIVADRVQLGNRNELETLARLIAPRFHPPSSLPPAPTTAMAPLSVLLLERVERGRPEFVQALLAALGTGYLSLPDGGRASLAGSLVLLTSNLCAREIHDAGRKEIGFSSGGVDLEESEKARIYQLCVSAAEKLWGGDLLGRIDDLIVFHRLGESQLRAILQRLLGDLNCRLAARGIECELEPAAESFLLERGGLVPRHGAWVLVRVFERFIVFPLADLVHTGKIDPGSVVRVDLEPPDRLRLAAGRRRRAMTGPSPVEIPVR